MMKTMTMTGLLCLALVGGTAGGVSAEGDSYAGPITRVFFQDHEQAVLYWADVTRSADGKLVLGKPAKVVGFPELNPERHNLVQMKQAGGYLVIGIRDDADGQFASGWVLIHPGTEYTGHGDHGHWSYDRNPLVLDYRLDKKQGNPAHVYVYDKRFYVANDRLNGYTRIDPEEYARSDQGDHQLGQPHFIKGGGNHITLAVVDDAVGYSGWIDGGGPNRGRVDVTTIAGTSGSKPTYSFKLPTGVIHGATANTGKVFFAPADGICWIEADVKLQQPKVAVQHIPLGKDGDKPRRTGAFANLGHYVLFVTGQGESSVMGVIDARNPESGPTMLKLGVKKLNKAITPVTVTTIRKETYALVFYDHDARVETPDYLGVVALDPNGDGDLSDATLAKILEVGPSNVVGHFGHHAIATDADGEWAFFTNPGDGTIAALGMQDWEVATSFPVGGMPTAILTHGGRLIDD